MLWEKCVNVLKQSERAANTHCSPCGSRRRLRFRSRIIYVSRAEVRWEEGRYEKIEQWWNSHPWPSTISGLESRLRAIAQTGLSLAALSLRQKGSSSQSIGTTKYVVIFINDTALIGVSRGVCRFHKYLLFKQYSGIEKRPIIHILS